MHGLEDKNKTKNSLMKNFLIVFLEQEGDFHAEIQKKNWLD